MLLYLHVYVSSMCVLLVMPVFILLIKTVQVKNLFMGQEVSPESTFKTAGDKTNFQKVAISPQEITIIDQNGYT